MVVFISSISAAPDKFSSVASAVVTILTVGDMEISPVARYGNNSSESLLPPSSFIQEDIMSSVSSISPLLVLEASRVRSFFRSSVFLVPSCRRFIYRSKQSLLLIDAIFTN